jgi:type IX secretion system PorP/SprF family membrane protein
MRRYFLMLLFLFGASQTIGQDLHFSQYRENPLNLNPALTGFFEGKVRVSLSHRNQWLSIPVPFSTYAASLDAQIFKRKNRRDLLGIGFQALSDVAGDSRFGTTMGSASLAYLFSLDDRGSNLLSLGASAAMVQRSIDYTQLVFDQQYNGSSFDPNRPNGEIFLKNSFSYLDFGVGINWYYWVSNDLTLTAGASYLHLNKPKQSLFDDTQVLLDARLNLHASALMPFNNAYDIEPMLFFAKQGVYNNLILGARLHQERNPNPKEHNAIAYGVFYRYRDAIILNFNWEYYSYTFGISYDVNVSSLARASYLRGGYELTASYILNPRKKNSVKKLPCPIF